MGPAAGPDGCGAELHLKCADRGKLVSGCGAEAARFAATRRRLQSRRVFAWTVREAKSHPSNERAACTRRQLPKLHLACATGGRTGFESPTSPSSAPTGYRSRGTGTVTTMCRARSSDEGGYGDFALSPHGPHQEIAVDASSIGSRDPTRSIAVDAPALYNLGTMTMVTFRGRSATTREGRVRAALSPK